LPSTSNHCCRFTGVSRQSARPTTTNRKNASVLHVYKSVGIVFETSLFFSVVKLAPQTLWFVNLSIFSCLMTF
jgi:hypothetical protein